MRPRDTSYDRELVQACLRNENEAWETLVRRYAGLVYAVPLRFGLDEDDSAEIFQTTWSTLWEHLAEVRDGTRVGAYLITVASRLSSRQAERVQQQVDHEVIDPRLHDRPDPDPLAQVEDWFLAREQTEVMRMAIERLPVRCRQLVGYLFYARGAPTYAEIARRLELSADTIGPMRGRCLRYLKEALEEMGIH